MTGILKVDTIQSGGGTTGLTIDSSGRLLKPAQPRFRATGNSGWFSLATTGQWETVTDFNVEDFDVGGCFNTTNSQFTVPVSGVYIVILRAWLKGNVDSANYLRVYNQTDGTALLEGGENGNNNDDHTIQLTGLLDLTAGKVLVPQGYRYPVGSQDVYVHSAYSEFSAILLA